MPGSNSQNPESSVLSMVGGIEVEVLNYGASLKCIRVPVAGKLVDVLLAYPANEDYLQDKVYLGATVGRYAGRIDKGVTRVEERPVQLLCNEQNNGHCLHGGPKGFSHRFWTVCEQSSDSICYEYVSADGDQGFPGSLTARVNYRLIGPNSLQIEFTAVTDQVTIVNLSNHAYFNLNSIESGVENHELWINSDRYTPLGENSLPTGEIKRVDDSVFDFRQPTSLGEGLSSADAQLELAGGYDHYFLLNGTADTPGNAARVYSPQSGIAMEIHTDQPGVQFYSGNWLGALFKPRAGLCLEFQDIPNEPNMDGFPSTVLNPGEIYRRQVTLQFLTG